ncbi:MAG: porin family protein [bacterium]|nr:porin family protein [bacterium]
MKKILFTTLLISILHFTSTKSNAMSFYSGLSLGETRSKIEDSSFDERRSFTFSVGSSFFIPLFPIRIEGEYFKFNSKKSPFQNHIYGSGINAYVNLPLLPILVPYIGLGISYAKEKIDNNETDTSKKSDGRIIPQYIIGLDLDLPTVIFAGSMEYRYINSDFKFDNEKLDSKYHVFLLKARLKF